MRREQKDTVHEFDLITTKLPFLSECHERKFVESDNSTQINVVVTCTAGYTCITPSDKFAKEIEASGLAEKF